MPETIHTSYTILCHDNQYYHTSSAILVYFTYELRKKNDEIISSITLVNFTVFGH
jgi:hypothetical protein